MKSKLAALAACMLIGGLASLATAQSIQSRRCANTSGVISCGPTAACHCNSGSSVVSPTVTASWCRDRGPTC